MLFGNVTFVGALLDLGFGIGSLYFCEGYLDEVKRYLTSLEIASGANWLPVIRTLLGRGASLNPHYKKSQRDDARRQWMSPAWSECRPCLAPEESIGILNLLIRSSTKPAMSDDIIVGEAGWGLCDLLNGVMRSIESESVRTAVVKDILSRDDQLIGLQGYCPVVQRPGYQAGQQGYCTPLFSAISWVRPELVGMLLQVKTPEQLRLRGYYFMDALMTVTHDFLSAHYGAITNVPKAGNPQRLDIVRCLVSAGADPKAVSTNILYRAFQDKNFARLRPKLLKPPSRLARTFSNYIPKKMTPTRISLSAMSLAVASGIPELVSSLTPERTLPRSIDMARSVRRLQYQAGYGPEQ
ncbi:hypothetical protein LTR10_003739 [Elasticomyces elasticus]|nr:hypothetical protein LTR10_003739 [Elasticomyces elasticus]